MNMKDVVSSMGTQIQEWIVKTTMTPQQMADRMIQSKLETALAMRESARKAKTQMMLIKDADGGRVTPLEAFEKKEVDLVALGGRLVKQKNDLLAGGKTEDDPAVKAVTLQIGQASQALQALRANPSYKTLGESYDTASDAYKQALANAQQAEQQYEVLKANLPMLMQALEVYKNAQALKKQSEKDKISPFSADNFMSGVAADVQEQKVALRASEEVDRDLTPEKPNDPVTDMLAAHESENTDAGIMDEFAKAAKKIKK
jgi:hypothetical protein